MSTVASAAHSVEVGIQKKLRIFMSYGHDSFEELAIQLDKDLRSRGHEVWFDKHELLPGTQWEYEIEKGLKWVSEVENSGWVIRRFVVAVKNAVFAQTIKCHAGDSSLAGTTLGTLL